MRNIKYLAFALLCGVAASTQSCSNEPKKSDQAVQKYVPDSLKEKVAADEAVQKDPQNPEMYIARARVFEKLGQIDPALRDVERATRLDSSKAEYYKYMGDLYLKRPNESNAIKVYEVAVAKDPNLTEAHLAIGKLYYYVKDRKKSILALNNALRLNPALAEAFFYRGLNYREDGKRDLAIREMLQAVERKPDYFDALEILGILYAEKGDAKAGQYYTSALELKPGSATTLYNRALFYQEIDSLERARKDYAALLQLQPNHNANYNMALVLSRMNRCSDAVPFLDKALANEPDNTEAQKLMKKCGGR